MPGTGKTEHLNRPLQKLYPLELSVGIENDKRKELTDIENGTREKYKEKWAENNVEARNPTIQSCSKGCTLAHEA